MMTVQSLIRILILGLAALKIVHAKLPSGITVSITGGPSKKPQSRCYEFERVEEGDMVVMNFNAYIADDSPSGVPGTLITSHREHGEGDSRPIAVPVGSDEIHPSWDLALVGLCENDKATIVIPPKYTKGAVFEGKDLPEDVRVQIDVEIVDILEEEDFWDSDDEAISDDDDEEEEEDIQVMY